MDISEIISFAIGLLIAACAGYLGWVEWRKASLTEKAAIVERVVLAIEQMYPHQLGSDRLSLVLDRLATLFPRTDTMELRELVEATVARMNLAKRGDAQSRGGYWTN